MALTKVSRDVLNTSIVDNGNATAITIDSSENVTFSGAVTAADLTLSDSSNPLLTITDTTNTTTLFLEAANLSTTVGTSTYHPLKFYTDNTEHFRIGPDGQFGLSGTNYGTSGQVLTSSGASLAPTWQDASGGGNIDGTTINPAAVQIGSTAVIDSSRNLVNINSVEIGNKVTLAESTDRSDVLQITGTTATWAGLQIRNSSGEGRWSFMTDGAMAGIYDDENGDWYMQFNEFGATEIFHNSSQKLTTTTTGVSITGDVTTASVYLNDTSTRIEEGSSNSVRIQTNSGYIDIGPRNTSWAHMMTDRPAFYFQKGLTVDTGVFSSYDEDAILRRAGTTADQLTIASGTSTFTTGLNVEGTMSLISSATDARYLHLPRGGGITLYGDSSHHHGIFSRNSSNAVADDILISSYGAVYFDLDSNANNTSGANFEITKHNGTAAIFKVDGETSDVTVYNSLYIPSRIYHTGDTNTYMQFHAADQWRVVTGGVERLEVNNNAVTIPGTLNVRTAISLADSDFLYFGSGNDVELFCNGTHMYMDLNSGIGNFYIRDGSTTRYTFNDNGSFTATGNITAYSDRRVKDEFELITDAVAKVNTLSGMTYVRTDMDDENRRYAGLIAQDVEAVLPEAVTELDDHKSLDYAATIALLVEAVKELSAEVAELKAKR